MAPAASVLLISISSLPPLRLLPLLLIPATVAADSHATRLLFCTHSLLHQAGRACSVLGCLLHCSSQPHTALVAESTSLRAWGCCLARRGSMAATVACLCISAFQQQQQHACSSSIIAALAPVTATATHLQEASTWLRLAGKSCAPGSCKETHGIADHERLSDPTIR